MDNTYRRRHSNKKSRSHNPPISFRVSQDLTKAKNPEVKRDPSGNVIYSSQYVGSEKFEYWIEYNENNQPAWYHDSRGYEWKCKYNSLKNISNFWDNTGYEERYDYYKNDIVIRTDIYGGKVKKVIDRSKVNITRDIFINSQ